VFGQVDWRISDLVGVTLGGRYTHEDKDFIGRQSDANGFNYKLFNCPVYGDPCQSALGFPVQGEPLRYYVGGTQKKKFNNFAPKVGIQLHPTDDVMVLWLVVARLQDRRLDHAPFQPAALCAGFQRGKGGEL
jgi:outer membrane receptor protein involved in Fe transport